MVVERSASRMLYTICIVCDSFLYINGLDKAALAGAEQLFDGRGRGAGVGSQVYARHVRALLRPGVEDPATVGQCWSRWWQPSQTSQHVGKCRSGVRGLGRQQHQSGPVCLNELDELIGWQVGAQV